MGTIITKKNGLFKLKCSISDEVHGVDLSEDDVKKHFMQRAVWKMFEEIIKIEMNFPNGYFINGKHVYPRNNEEHMKGEKWIIENYNDESIREKFMEVIKKYKLEEYFTSLI